MQPLLDLLSAASAMHERYCAAALCVKFILQ